MQSSLWKLLTTAGFIGIGTLFVLEVQNRLTLPGDAVQGQNGSSAQAVAGSNGVETSVIPDDSTDLDRFLASSDPAFELQDPTEFDKVGGQGSPAPPSDDVSQTVHKDDLTDGTGPFAIEEPSLDMAAAAKSRSPQADPAFSDTGTAAVEVETVKPASFSSDTANTTVDPASSKRLPSGRSEQEDVAFREETPAAAPSRTSAENTATASDSAPIMFFNNSGESGGSSSATETAAPLAKAQLPPGSDRTAMASDAGEEPPSLQFPAPVPDVTRPAPISEAEEDSSPMFDSSSSETDKTQTAPAENATELRPITPAIEEELPSFGLDESPTEIPDPGPDRTTSPEIEPEPFTQDESTPEIGTPRPGAPSEFPNPTPRNPVDGTRDGTPARDDSEPFGGPGDSNELPTEPLPLPIADDAPVRKNRPAPRPRSGASDSAGSVSGVMRPQLTIQKHAPDAASVGVSHEYTIVVTNEGESPAYDVIVEDELGTAADIVDSRPVAEFNRTTGQLSWTFAELEPQDRKEITVRITPTGEGTLDGVATVRFKAQVRSETVITAPKLQIEVTAPDEVKVGDEVNLQYLIRNDGTGDASNVILRSVLPPGLKHPEGGDLEYEIPLLRSKGEETVELTVIAAEPGEQIRVTAEVTASGVSADQTSVDVAIVGAQLSVERLGPERRFVGRSASYQNIITNETNFEATNAIVVEYVPEGMQFVSANHDGKYNPESREVRWAIDRLLPAKQAVLEIELVAGTAGQKETVVEVIETAGFRSRAAENTVVTVEDLHNVTAEISRQDEPVPIGERFGFTITIDNRGTAVARNVQMSVQVPPEIKVLAAGTREVAGKLMSGNLVKYDTVLSIQPDSKMTFQLTLQGQHAVNNALVQAYLKSDEMQEPLIVSESVTVFDDQP